jgi:tRNA (adenine22-N1)-methyltransferase
MEANLCNEMEEAFLNRIQISERLATIAAYVQPVGGKLADIGSDHAYLPIYLKQKGWIDSAVAGELNEGPFRGAVQHVRSYGLTGAIEVRKGNGLVVIQPGEVNVITIAGMGGGTITEILQTGEAKLAGVKRLVLSPQGDGPLLRRWLLEHGWQIVAEDLVHEDEQIYEIVVAERGEMAALSEVELEFGPLLLAKRHPLLLQRTAYERGRIDRALKSLEKATGESGAARREELLAKKRQLEEVELLVRG